MLKFTTLAVGINKYVTRAVAITLGAYVIVMSLYILNKETIAHYQNAMCFKLGCDQMGYGVIAEGIGDKSSHYFAEKLGISAPQAAELQGFVEIAENKIGRVRIVDIKKKVPSAFMEQVEIARFETADRSGTYELPGPLGGKRSVFFLTEHGVPGSFELRTCENDNVAFCGIVVKIDANEFHK